MTKLRFRLLWCKGPGSRLQDPGLQGVCWGSGAVPQLPRRGVPWPNRSTPGLPPFALCKWARSSTPTVTPSHCPAFCPLAVGVLPPDLHHLTGHLLTAFPQWATGTGLTGELRVTRLPQPRPSGRLPAGCAAAPRADCAGLCPQDAFHHSIPSPCPLQADPAISSQYHKGLASPSPDLFLSLYLLFLFYFAFFWPTASLLQALCTSRVSCSSAQGLRWISEVDPGMGDRNRSLLTVNSGFVPNELCTVSIELPCAPCSNYNIFGVLKLW